MVDKSINRIFSEIDPYIRKITDKMNAQNAATPNRIGSPAGIRSLPSDMKRAADKDANTPNPYHAAFLVLGFIFLPNVVMSHSYAWRRSCPNEVRKKHEL